MNCNSWTLKTTIQREIPSVEPLAPSFGACAMHVRVGVRSI